MPVSDSLIRFTVLAVFECARPPQPRHHQDMDIFWRSRWGWPSRRLELCHTRKRVWRLLRWWGFSFPEIAAMTNSKNHSRIVEVCRGVKPDGRKPVLPPSLK